MPWDIEKRGDEFCVIKRDNGESEGCHETRPEAEAQMAALYASEGKGIDMSRDSFTVYKQEDGTYRWASVSSVAVKDKEFEIVTEKAQDDAIQHANDTGEFGEIDLVHIDGTDVGKCDMMARSGKRLLESGTFDDTDLARGAIKALQKDPDYWGVSIQFVYDPSKFDGEKYNGNIRIKKRTILPQEMAASYGTKLVAIGGKDSMEQKQVVSDKAREALELLNVPEEEIETLAEKQIEVEPNTVDKEAEPVETPEVEVVEVEKEVKPNLWERLKTALSKSEAEEVVTPDAETDGEEVVEVESVEGGVETSVEESKEVDLTEMVKGMFDVYTEATVEAVAGALKQRDEQIATLGEALLVLSEQIKAIQGPIEDKIEKRLAELPKIVKAAPSETAVIDKPTSGMLPFQGRTKTVNYTDELVKSVQEVTARLGSTPAVEV